MFITLSFIPSFSILQKIIDRSLTAGIFPSYMKYAHVIPIPKNQSINKSTFSNYRPISNLSFISKTIERIIAKQLRTYINNNNILHKLQSDYTTDKSTETSLLHTLNNIGPTTISKKYSHHTDST